MTERFLPIIGMHCVACAEKIERAVAQRSGVREAAVLYTERMLRVRFDPETISLEELAHAVQEVGFELILADTTYELADRHRRALLREEQRMRRNVLGAWGASLLMMGGMFLSLPSFLHHLLMFVAATSVYFVFAMDYHRSALKQLTHGVFSMDTLVSLSSTISYLSGILSLIDGWGIFTDAHIYFDATVMIPAFVLLGKWLEQRATKRTGDAITALVERRPKWALQMRDGVATEVPIETLQKGDRVRVRAGEIIPVDGVLIKGATTVDEQMISGEPLPVEKVVGSTVFAGTLNRSGAFTLEAQSVGSDTVLGTIIETIRRTQAEKPPIRRIADRIASIFVPVVLALSVLTLLGWLLWGPEAYAWAWGIRCAISVLVIACPCALGLATPTAITVMVGEMARRHILIQKATAPEILPRVTKVFLDKTGTITTGCPEVVEAKWWSEDPERLKPLLIAIEQGSTHPLAHALIAHLSGDGMVDIPTLGEVETVVGQGVKARIGGQLYRVGSASFVGTQADEEAKGSEVFFSCEGHLLARFVVADQVTKASREAIALLQKKGVEVILLTGDQASSARVSAGEAGIAEWHAEMMPQEKYAMVCEARRRGEVVAMIGDGINDSEALGEADVSIALASGSDIAVAVADITLAQQDLRLFVEAIEIATQSIRTIHFNFFWALLYNVIAIPVAAGVLFPSFHILLSPAIASSAMALSSLSVVLNSLLLKRRLRKTLP